MRRDEIRAKSAFSALMKDFREMGKESGDLCGYCLHCCVNGKLIYSPNEKSILNTAINATRITTSLFGEA